MKAIYSVIFIVLILFSCKKSSEDKAEAICAFKEQEITLGDQAGKGTFTIAWSHTEWELSTLSSGFISNFSYLKGGSTDHSNTTRVTFDYSANTMADERLQEVFLTNKVTGEKTKLTIKQSNQPPVEIAVDPAVLYQQITGFGGMNNVWAAGFLTVEEVQKMYSPDGLGYNMMRIMIYPNKNDWGRDVATTLKAQSLGARILATPWTPPAAMKSSNSTLHGHLLPEKYADYVKHLNDFIDFMKDKGITIEAVSIQNEPDWSPEYDGCEWTPEQILDFVKNHAGGIKAKVVAAEAVNFKKMYTDPVLNDPLAVNNLDIAGGHLYGGGLADYPLARAKGKEIWMTEHLLNDEKDNFGLGWDQALVFGKELNDCMKANFNAYFWWYLKRSYSMLGDGDKGTVTGEILKRGYVMSHFAKFATGRTRVQAGSVNGNNNVHVTAYKGAQDLTLIIINQGMQPVPSIKINLPEPVKDASAIETSENQNMVSKNVTLSEDKKSATIGLPAKSIVSLRLSK